MQRLQLRFDVSLQLLIRRGTGRTRSEGHRLASELQRRGSTEIARPGKGRQQDQERFRAVHIYPSVKLRSRSSESNQGRISAGGARKRAARRNNGPGKN